MREGKIRKETETKLELDEIDREKQRPNMVILFENAKMFNLASFWKNCSLRSKSVTREVIVN